MALVHRLRALLRRPASASKVGLRRPTSSPDHDDTLQEDALRAMLAEDPNNVRAFKALAEIVRRRAAEAPADADPLIATADERQRAADLAVWALGEELAGHPRAWYPLVELARLSVHDDLEGATRRLVTAAERDESGHALAEAVALLRHAGLPTEGLGLGVGHWRVGSHVPEVGRELVLAAVEAGRPAEARGHLDAMATYGRLPSRMRAELEQVVAEASSHSGSAQA